MFLIPFQADRKYTLPLADYIENHYQEDISLTDVAEHFQYTSSYFSRHFKETLGVNFLSYLSIVRVGHAAEQLSNGQENLTKCAFDNGFPIFYQHIQKTVWLHSRGLSCFSKELAFYTTCHNTFNNILLSKQIKCKHW